MASLPLAILAVGIVWLFSAAIGYLVSTYVSNLRNGWQSGLLLSVIFGNSAPSLLSGRDTSKQFLVGSLSCAHDPRSTLVTGPNGTDSQPRRLVSADRLARLGGHASGCACRHLQGGQVEAALDESANGKQLKEGTRLQLDSFAFDPEYVSRPFCRLRLH